MELSVCTIALRTRLSEEAFRLLARRHLLAREGPADVDDQKEQEEDAKNWCDELSDGFHGGHHYFVAVADWRPS